MRVPATGQITVRVGLTRESFLTGVVGPRGRREYRLLVLPDRADRALSGSIVVNGVTVAPAIPSDGSPVRLETADPGRWTVAPIIQPAEKDGSFVSLRVSSATLPGDWAVYAGFNT